MSTDKSNQHDFARIGSQKYQPRNPDIKFQAIEIHKPDHKIWKSQKLILHK